MNSASSVPVESIADALTPERVRALGLTGRDFLKESDFTKAELSALLDLALQLKVARQNKIEPQLLIGKNLAAIFEKTSTRTRIAFDIAMSDQGGRTTFLDSSSSQIGHKESPADTARVLERMFDAIEYRGTEQSVVQELADNAKVPVYNGLTDQWHPTQMLADFLTMREHAADPESLSYCFIGDTRFNMANSLLTMGAIMGSDVRLVAPSELWPDPEIVAAAQSLAAVSGAKILISENLEEGVRGVEFVHTDVWVSMGEPKEEWSKRIALLRDYQVNDHTMSMAADNAKFMHCLPAYHDTKTVIGSQLATEFGLDNGVEVTNEVFESPASIVFDQAENRLHSIKAILVATLA